MSIILDAIVIAIIVLTVSFSAKRGFIRVAIELAGFIAAILISFTISTPLADTTYDKIIEPPLVKSVSGATGDTASQVVDKTWGTLPSFIKNNSDKIGISKEKFDEKIASNMQQGAESAAQAASQNIVKPVATKVLGLIYSIIIMIVLSFVLRILARYVNKLFSFSIVGKINRLLGGIIGIPKGIILAIVFCMIASLIASLSKDGFLIFNTETINNSTVFNFFYDLTPFN